MACATVAKRQCHCNRDIILSFLRLVIIQIRYEYLQRDNICVKSFTGDLLNSTMSPLAGVEHLGDVKSIPLKLQV